MIKKLLFCITACLLLVAGSLRAQTYVQGNLTVTVAPTWTHDSSACETNFARKYQISVQNAGLNDTLRVVNMTQGGTLAAQQVNTAGQSPWNFMLPIGGGGYGDCYVVNGILTFPDLDFKFVCGQDTVYLPAYVYNFPIPDACNLSTISGKIYIDYNSDCIFDSGDSTIPLAIPCATTNYTPQMLPLNERGQGNLTTGDYSITMVSSWLTSTTVYPFPPELQFLFTLSPCAAGNNYVFGILPQTNVDFPFNCSSHVDVQCYANTPNDIVRPGHSFMLYPLAFNTGCDSVSGKLRLVLDPNVSYDPALSSNPATLVNGDTLTWIYNHINNVSNGAYWNNFFAGVHLTPATTVTVGDTLCFHLYTDVPPNDIDPVNNEFSLCIPVVNSYDPNEKEVSPKGQGAEGNIPQNTDSLTYTIYFQNTGTAPALNVLIMDTLDAAIDARNIRIIGSSSAMSPMLVNGNIMRFDFSNINLPDSASNEPASHGFVKFTAKLKSGLPLGTTIKNTANIYFDYNPAIVTNTTINTLSNITTGINVTAGDNNNILLYPNPAGNVLNIAAAGFSNRGPLSIHICTLSGQEVMQASAPAGEASMDVSKLPPGVYFVRLNSNKQTAGKVFVKE